MAASEPRDLVEVPKLFPPSVVLEDKALLAWSRQIFKERTCIEGCELLVEIFGIENVFVCVETLRIRLPTTNVAVRAHQPQDATLRNATLSNATLSNATPHNATPHDPPSHDTTKLYDYFTSKLPEAKSCRIERVIQVAKSIDDTEEFDLPSLTIEMDTSNDPFAHARMVYQNIHQTKLAKLLLYFVDAIERCEHLSFMQSIGHSKGRSSKSVAFDHIHEKLDLERKEVANMNTLGRRYFALVEHGGPASLYSIPVAKSRIKKLNDDEIEEICNYRKEHRKDKETLSRSNDFKVACDYVNDLQRIGFTYARIAQADTRLTKLICKYVDPQWLVEGQLSRRKHNRDDPSQSLSSMEFQQQNAGNTERIEDPLATNPSSTSTSAAANHAANDGQPDYVHRSLLTNTAEENSRANSSSKRRRLNSTDRTSGPDSTLLSVTAENDQAQGDRSAGSDGRATSINQTLILTTGNMVVDNDSYTPQLPVASLPSVLASESEYECRGAVDFDRPENYNKEISTRRDNSTQLSAHVLSADRETQLSDYTSSAGQETRLGDYITSADRDEIAEYARTWGLD